jgi:hypothetical protein
MTEEKKRMSVEDWNTLPVEEQKDNLDNNPNVVPEEVLVKDERYANKPIEKNSNGRKEPSVENLVGEAVRKATKELKDQFKMSEEHYKDTIDTLQTAIKAQSKPAQNQDGNAYVSKAKKIAEDMMVYDSDNDKYSVNPDAILDILSLGGNMAMEINNVNKQRDIEIQNAINGLDENERELLGGEVRSELSVLPIDRQLTKADMERAVLIAKGRKADVMVEQAKKSLQAEVNKGNVTIDGIDDGIDDSKVINSSGNANTSGKVPTPRQKRLAKEKGISEARQMASDERIAKRKKEKK